VEEVTASGVSSAGCAALQRALTAGVATCDLVAETETNHVNGVDADVDGGNGALVVLPEGVAKVGIYTYRDFCHARRQL